MNETGTETDTARASRASLERYFDDMATIRRLMTRYEEQSLVRPWVFVVWGVLVVAGALGSAELAHRGIAALRIFVLVWLPVLIVGGASETLGWYLQSRRSGVALFTPRKNRLLATYGGIIAITTILVLHMAPTGLSVGVILAIGALPLFAYAQLTYARLFIEAFGLLIAAALGELWLPDVAGTMSAAGIVVGASYIVAGLHSRIEEQRRDE